MEPFFNIADLYFRSALNGRANSALPNAPVQPLSEHPGRMTSLFAALRRPARRPRVAIRRAQYSPGCSAT